MTTENTNPPAEQKKKRTRKPKAALATPPFIGENKIAAPPPTETKPDAGTGLTGKPVSVTIKRVKAKNHTPPTLTRRIADIAAQLTGGAIAGQTARYYEQPPVKLVHSAIGNAMKEIHAVAKTEKHEAGFMFRRIDILIAELNPILVKHHLYYRPIKVKKYEQTDRLVKLADGTSFVNIFTTVHVRYRMTCTIDGSYDDAEAIGEGVSEQQFSSNAALTMAEKAYLCDIFCIPVYGEDDPEAANPERSAGIIAPQAPVYTEPSAKVDGDPQPTLFDPPEATVPTTRKKKEPKEPQVTATGGATVPAEEPAPAPEKDAPISDGYIKMLRANLKSTGKEETALCEQFKVAAIGELKKGDFEKVLAWIQG